MSAADWWSRTAGVLDRDPFMVPATELSSVQVRATFVDGQPV